MEIVGSLKADCGTRNEAASLANQLVDFKFSVSVWFTLSSQYC